jgi:NAD-dependent dihydropyrimidine dehydrogenase PreA subunit
MSYKHIYFNESVCIGCNICVEVCPCDVFAPNPEKGKPPIVRYAEECYFDGSCINLCPQKGAIEIVTPFPMRGGFQKIGT